MDRVVRRARLKDAARPGPVGLAIVGEKRPLA